MRINGAVIALGLLALSGAAARAEELGNATRGLDYVKKHCAECHAVDAAEAYSPNPDAPTFESVANTPGMTARALVVWLQSPHPTMPNLMVPAEDRDNVVAYILSLKPLNQ